jgi:membrane protein DedA with SNARE-associated domain
MTADPVPLLTIVALILVKEAGVPIPVPGDLVVIGAGVAAGRGDFDPLVALSAIVVASIAGGVVQYGLLRSVARPALLRLLGRFGSAARVDRQTERLRRGGARAVAVARSTPGVRIVAIAASALAGVPAIAFIGGLAAGNAFFIAAHFGLGYVLGESVLTSIGGALAPLAIAAIGLMLVGALGWLVLGRLRGRRQGSALSVALTWTDACCPACLSAAALEAVRSNRPAGRPARSG